MTDESYWDRPCVGCRDTGHTNRECVAQVAANVGLTLEQAMRQFRPTHESPVNTHWSSGWEAKAEADAEY